MKRDSEKTTEPDAKRERTESPEGGVARRSWEDEIKGGKWQRSKSAFQSVISEEHPTYKPEPKRYHMYLAKACPWATRMDILIRLLGMQDAIGVTYVDPVFASVGEGRTGWVFTEEWPDTLHPGSKNLYEVYLKYHPDYEGKATTPMLLDTKTNTIVSNESRDMLKSLCWGCRSLHKSGIPDYYPTEKGAEIDEWIDKLYDPLLNGVYKTGFAGSQEAYDECIDKMFSMLDKVDKHLGNNKWMLGDTFSVLDLVLGVTLTRFDAVYYVHFMCCMKHVYEYANLGNYARAFYQTAEVTAATDLKSCKMHYFKSHHIIAPMKIIATSNANADLELPHNRDELFP